MAPNVHYTAFTEKGVKSPRRIAGERSRSKATTIPSSIKNSIEVSTDDSGRARIDVLRDKIEEGVSGRVLVGGI